MLEKYAQEIVQDIAEIIGYEVVMSDREGIIIGSSDPDRLGKHLFEAPVVIRTRKVYLIDEEEVRKFPNAVVGVTYPIEDMTGEVIGSIAITGKPEDVNPFALIVKKHAELFIKERVFLGSLLEKERTLQNFIRELEAFDPRISEISLLERKARYFGYRSDHPYCVIWVRIRNLPSMMEDLVKRSGKEKINRDLALQSLKNRVSVEIRNVFSEPGDISAPFAADDFVILHVLKEGNGQRERLKDQCSEVLRKLSDAGFMGDIAIGSIANALEMLSRSFADAGEVMEKGRSCDPGQNIFSMDDLRFEILLSSTRPDQRETFLSLKLDCLKEQRDWSEIKETILAWCDTSFSIKEASERLHIHRNTLKYRLEKIESICSLDLRDFRSLLELYTAIRMDCFRS